MSLHIYFENMQDKHRVSYALKILVRDAIEATLAYENVNAPCEVSVTFADNEGIQAINREYRNIDAPTDVLSFPLFEEQGGKKQLGDVVLSLEKCAAQAEDFGHSFERETAFLCVHSMLHLLGYDHVNGDEEEADMRRRQTEILETLGLGVK